MREGGGEEREKEIVMDGYMLMNKKRKKKKKKKKKKPLIDGSLSAVAQWHFAHRTLHTEGETGYRL